MKMRQFKIRCWGKQNESGRTMLEVIAVLSVMALLSIAIVWGYVEASRRKTVAVLSDLATKSAAGVITSGYLEQRVADYEPLNGKVLQVGELLPLTLYTSNVQQVAAGSDEADFYGKESFWGDRGAVLSAYALRSGRGVVINLNQFPSEVCNLLLTANMDYEGVVDLNSAIDAGHNATDYTIYYDVEQLEDAAVRKKLCSSSDGELLDFGLVFANTGMSLENIPNPQCNPDCAVEVLGECALKYDLPACEGEGCERKFFRMQSCQWVCYDGVGETCAAPKDRPVWDDETKTYICRNQADCQENQWCDSKTRSCKNCDTNYVGTDMPNENETEDKYKYCYCPTGFYVDDKKACTCVGQGGQWTNEKPCCAELNAVSATTDAASQRCCPKLTFWNGQECSLAAGVTCDEEGTCGECNAENAAEKCPGRDQYCDLTTNTCQFCSQACGGEVSDDKLSCTGGCEKGYVCLSQYYDSNCCYQEAPDENTVLECVPIAVENPDLDWARLPDCNTVGASGAVCRAEGRYNGAKFIISAQPMTFPAAETWCRSMGWHLATRTEACMKADAGAADGWNCYNIQGKFGYKNDTGNETVWIASSRSAVNGSCCTQLSVTNSCSDNHATDARRSLYALCASGALATDSPNCAMGEYSDSAGCHTCPAGYYCLGDLEKYPCPEGFYCPAGTSGPCTETKDEFGKVTSSCPASAAVPCQPGEYCPAKTTKKTLCPQGSYCPTVTEKYTCPAGAYCPAGTVKPIPCPIGTFRNGTGGYVIGHCSACQQGAYCPDEGMTTSTACPAGYYCPVGSIEPTACPEGTFRTATNGSAVGHCTACPKGSYCPDKGMTASTVCDVNTYTDKTGQTKCTDCAEGTYAAPGSYACQACSVGTYAVNGECTTCPIGYYCPGNGQRVECPENYICPEEDMGKPKPCEEGTYTDAKKQTECLTCQEGHYCPVPTEF